MVCKKFFIKFGTSLSTFKDFTFSNLSEQTLTKLSGMGRFLWFECTPYDLSWNYLKVFSQSTIHHRRSYRLRGLHSGQARVLNLNSLLANHFSRAHGHFQATIDYCKRCRIMIGLIKRRVFFCARVTTILKDLVTDQCSSETVRTVSSLCPGT